MLAISRLGWTRPGKGKRQNAAIKFLQDSVSKIALHDGPLLQIFPLAKTVQGKEGNSLVPRIYTAVCTFQFHRRIWVRD